MLLRHLAALIIASTASAFFSMDAAANPRFTVENNSNESVVIRIFNGDDKTCITPSKTKTVKANKSKRMGCEGNGTGHCIVQVNSKRGKKLCENYKRSCSLEVPKDNRLVIDGTRWCDVE